MSEAQRIRIALSRTPRGSELVGLVSRSTGLPERRVVVTDWRREIAEDGGSWVTIAYRLRRYRDGAPPEEVDMAEIDREPRS